MRNHTVVEMSSYVLIHSRKPSFQAVHCMLASHRVDGQRIERSMSCDRSSSCLAGAPVVSSTLTCCWSISAQRSSSGAKSSGYASCGPSSLLNYSHRFQVGSGSLIVIPFIYRSKSRTPRYGPCPRSYTLVSRAQAVAVSHSEH